jgi:hypothetical protein
MSNQSCTCSAEVKRWCDGGVGCHRTISVPGISYARPNYKALAARIANDPSASYWLKAAVIASNQRDPVDALNDAEALVQVCKQRLAEAS